MRITTAHTTSAGTSSSRSSATHEFDTQLPYPAATVWDWHTRPGAVVRLTPGMTRMRVLAEAGNLRDGTTVFALPGRLRWVARHDPGGFVEGRSFTDACVNAPFRATRWRHDHLVTGNDDGTSTLTDRISARVPTALLSRVAGYRRRQLTDDLAHLATLRDLDTPPRVIAVTGASGLVGTQLTALLRTAGHTVVPLVRTPDAAPAARAAPGTPGSAGTDSAAGTAGTAGPRFWDPADPAPDLLDGVDAVVHLAGAPIMGRFTDAHTAAVRDSRVGPTRRLAAVAASCGVGTFVCASAVGIYGTRRPEPVGEDAAPGEGVLAGIVADWEADCDAARDAGLRVVTVRTGLVLAGGAPLLTLLSASSRVGGGRLGGGDQHFPWIGIDDLTDIYHRAVVDPALSGPVNAVAPEEITEAEFASALADVQTVRVPLRVPVPSAGPAVLLGRTGAAELALADQHVRPEVLTSAGHPFRFTAVRDLLAHEVG